MPSVEDWINNPLGIIQTLFDQKGNFESCIVRDYFGDKLKTVKALSWIPSLNDTPLHRLRANSLVRFRCMVQDMYDPEFYLGKYEVKDKQSGQTCMQSGKYKDVAECGANQTIDVESQNNVTMDRMTLYCVPVPGEADWVKKAHGDLSKTKTKSFPSTSKMPSRVKRGLDEETEENGQAMEAMAVSGDGVANGRGETGVVDMETENGESKRQQTQRQPAAGSANVPDLNFPLPAEEGPACLVKVYDDINSYKVNDVVEFIGVLSVDPSLAHFHPDSSSGEGETVMSVVEETPEELLAHAPPPSLVPRLHVVLSNHMTHVNPLVPRPNTDDYNSVLEAIQSDIDATRAQLLSILEHALLGDTLAAQYFLCHLLSTVYGRADVIPLGKFCVNLSNCPKSSTYSDLMHHLVSNLVTQSHLLHMSLENMNTLRFSPKKDYTANRLSTGILQLADETNLVLDETALQPGQLDVNGKDMGVSVLNNLKREENDKSESERFIQDAILTIGRQVQAPILQDLQQSPWYSIMIDETTDVYGRYLKDGQSRTEFLRTIPLRNGTAATIVEALLDFLQDINLPLKKMCAIGSDGASVMVGKKNGFRAKLRELVPHILSNHCIAHRLALAVGQSTKDIAYLKTFRSVLDQLHRFYKYSSVRTAALHQIQELYDDKTLKLTQAKDVRWLSHDLATNTLRKCFPAVVSSLEREAQERDDAQALGLATFVKSNKFIGSLLMMCDVFPHVCTVKSSAGVRNIQALGNVISWQKVEYDFNFHKQDFHSNVATLILSEGKSILPSDSLLPLQPCVQVDNLRDYFTLLDPRLTDDFLTKCRTYIGLARHMEYSLSDAIQTVIQNDFVALRKDDPKNMSVDDFHSLLSLTRLLSLAQLTSSPTLDIWNRAKKMEQERKSRISEIAARNQATV